MNQIRRLLTTGPVEGNLDNMKPFLFIGTFGGNRGKRGRGSAGRFSFALRNRGLFFLCGIILPLSRCRNREMRKALTCLAWTLDNAEGAKQPASLKNLQALIDGPFDGALVIRRDLFDLNHGAIRFVMNSGLCRNMVNQFEYVDAIEDHPSGVAIPVSSRPFRWRSYGELLEWMHDWDDEQSHGLEHCNIMLVHGETDSSILIPPQLREPKIIPYAIEQFLSISPKATTHGVCSRFSGTWGDTTKWTLHAEAGGTNEMPISDFHLGILQLCTWIHSIEQGRAVELHVETEGVDRTFVAMNTHDPALIFLTVFDPYERSVCIQSIVSRHQLVRVFKRSVIDYFRNEFDEGEAECQMHGREVPPSEVKRFFLELEWLRKEPRPFPPPETPGNARGTIH